MLRPEPMGWVDIVLDRQSAPAMFEAIASTELFEPDRPHDPEFGDWNEVSSTGSRVKELRARLRPYEPCLPPPDMQATTSMERMMQFSKLAEDLNRRVTGWLEAAKPDLQRLSIVEHERESLRELKTALSLLPSSIELGLWRSRIKTRRNYLPILGWGDADDVAALLENMRDTRLDGHFPPHSQLAAIRGVVPRDQHESISRQCRQYGLHVLDIPQWLKGGPEEGMDSVAEHLGELDREITENRDRLAGFSKDYRMAGARWLIERQDWLENVLAQAHQGKHFVHLGGWVPSHRYPELIDRLKQTGNAHLTRLDQGGSHGSSPTVLRNPRWARSFELFVNAFGIPDADEVDPSIILALVTPLMFGYMFGDVGQGLLLVVMGWGLKRRLAWTGLLVPAGVSAMAFGFLYGSVFSVEHWIPALWIHPMDRPLIVLGIPMVFGALLMLLSLVFGYVEARWRRRNRQWLTENIPLLLCYLAPAVWFISPEAGLGFVLVAFLVLLLPAPSGRHLLKRVADVPAALLRLLENWVQLMINTLSFARLGAFCLAHAGLSMALVSLAGLPASAISSIVILIIGNLVITALEGLVVSVQTTRLVMFEFFRRFFVGTGRRFQPLTLGGHPGAGGES